MKIRNQLLVVFIITTIFPLLLSICCISYILHWQTYYYNNNYQNEKSEYNILDFILNPLHSIQQVSITECNKVEAIVKDNPDTFLDKKYLKAFDTKLQKKNCCLIVLKDTDYIYKSKKANTLLTIPIAPDYHKKYDKITFIDSTENSIINEMTFFFRDGAFGQVLLISDFSGSEDKCQTTVSGILISLFAIFIATNALLFVWIYQSIVRPLNILHLATAQIGNGILNEPIPINGKSEISQLCTDFDNMRLRLKNIINRQIQTEENLQDILVSLSHDLKTPITAIKGYTEGLLDGVADTAEKQQRYIQTIYAKTNDISYLIDELSIYAKIERNVMVYDFSPINLQKYFDDCIDYLKLDLDNANTTIDFYNSTDFSTMVLIDPNQLRRVIQNIVENAVKYNDKEQGHIYVRIENIPEKTAKPIFRNINENGTVLIPARVSESFVRIEIEDNGPGIAKKDLPYIFEKFYRADSSRNSSKRGSGLGLSIVKMIIFDHGGEVGVDSIEGTGSCFFFTLKTVTQDNKEDDNGKNINYRG